MKQYPKLIIFVCVLFSWFNFSTASSEFPRTHNAPRTQSTLTNTPEKESVLSQIFARRHRMKKAPGPSSRVVNSDHSDSDSDDTEQTPLSLKRGSPKQNNSGSAPHTMGNNTPAANTPAAHTPSQNSPLLLPAPPATPLTLETLNISDINNNHFANNHSSRHICNESTLHIPEALSPRVISAHLIQSLRTPILSGIDSHQ